MDKEFRIVLNVGGFPSSVKTEEQAKDYINNALAGLEIQFDTFAVLTVEEAL